MTQRDPLPGDKGIGNSRDGRISRPRIRPLTGDEIEIGLSGFPPLLTVDEAARLLRVSKSTLYGHVSRGKYRDAVKRGRPLVFYRDRLVRDYFRNR